jgi:arginase family enzyme
MTEDLVKILSMFKDPALLVAVIAIAAEGWTIFQLFKILQRRDAVIESLATEVAEVNTTLSKLVTLCELLVFGRRKEGE